MKTPAARGGYVLVRRANYLLVRIVGTNGGIHLCSALRNTRTSFFNPFILIIYEAPHNGSALSHHAVQSGANGYGRDISVGSFLYAKGSPHLKIGGQVAFYEFGVESADHIGILREDLETLLGLNLHYRQVLGTASHLRVSVFGDRVFHQGGIRGYAGTNEVELRLHLAGTLSLLAEYRVRERAYAGQHTGTPSPFTPNDPTLVYSFGQTTDNLPARALSQSFNLGLTLLLGT